MWFGIKIVPFVEGDFGSFSSIVSELAMECTNSHRLAVLLIADYYKKIS